MSQLNGAQALIRLLERQGVKTLFGIPGGANLPVYDALAESSIHHVLARHEQGAGFMAQGMARATGRPGVFLATSGPGATNCMTALADARLDSVPVVCLTGQVPSPLLGTDAFQEIDTYGMSIPLTKHNFLVRSAEELLYIIPEAFRIASSGRPGPVLVDIPRDVQVQELFVESWPEPGVRQDPPRLDEGELERAAEMINRAERPVMCVGGGVVQSGGSPLAVKLAETAGMPVVSTLMGLGSFPRDHPLFLGMLGMHAAPYTNFVLEECDLFLAVGSRFDDRATGRLNQFCPSARVVHMDIDPAELNKLKEAHISLRADAAEGLDGLLRLVEGRARTEWKKRMAFLRREFDWDMPDTGDVLNAYGFILAAASCLSEGDIIATDVGKHQMRTAQVYPFARPGHWLTSGGLGTMGFGLPAAIGAAMARPDRTVACFTGDGSLLMNIQEMAVAVEQNANVKILLSDNQGLGLVRQQQDFFFSGRQFGSSYSTPTDYVTVARGFGLRAVDLGASRNPMDDLREALATPGPCLVRAPMKEDGHVLPMVPPGAANRDMIVTA